MTTALRDTSAERPTVAIVGTGIGGTELAGYLGLAGFRVRAHDIRPKAVSGIAERGGIDVEDVKSGFAPIERATTNLAEAVTDADLIIVATLNNDHQVVAKELAPLLRGGQTVLLMPGCVGGTLEFRAALDHWEVRAPMLLGEMDNFPFTGQVLGPAHLQLASIKRRLLVAALPATDTSRLVQRMRPLFPQVEAAASVLQTALSTMNPVVHVPGMLLNAGRIESGKSFQYYGEGITLSVARATEVLDGERVAVARAFGVAVPTQREWLFQTYGLEGGSLYDLIQRLQAEIFKHSPAPDRLDHRYVAEDVPYGLVPLAALGTAVGVATPVASALVTIASAALGRDFQAEGRTLAKMGLAGLSVAEIRSRVQ